jgi:CRP-like cAMP-binding protein
MQGVTQMTSPTVSAARALIRKLETISVLSDAERHAIEAIPMLSRGLKAGQDIVRQGDRPTQCCLLIEGWAYRYKVTDTGQRQIMSFHLPGDFPDLQSLNLPVMDHNIAALTDVTVAMVQHDWIWALIDSAPLLSRILWRETLVDASVFREWVLNVGRRQAENRIAHIICEMFTRMASLGLTDRIDGKDVLLWPMTQADLADAAGMSVVHANRSLQNLRHRGLIKTAGRDLTILEWPDLATLAGFNPDYLCLRPREALYSDLQGRSAVVAGQSGE